VEAVARYVGRSARAVAITFIDGIICFLICGDRGFFTLSPKEQRCRFTAAGARMFSVSYKLVRATSLTGDADDRDKPNVQGVWLTPTSDIVAFDGAGLGFQHYPLIERVIMASICLTAPFPYVSRFLYFYLTGNDLAGLPRFPIEGGCIGRVMEDQPANQFLALLCSPEFLKRLYKSFRKGLEALKDRDLWTREVEEYDAAAQRAFELCRACICSRDAVR
jgi:hypothetical protein